MKRILLMLLCPVLFGTALAQKPQDQTKHLTFKGIPIDGSIDEFAAHLKAAGMTYYGKQDNIVAFTGDFAGYKECIITVIPSPSTGRACGVGVIFPPQEEWGSLESQYTLLKAMLTEKYGKPSECVEEFRSYTGDDNMLKLLALQSDNCTWYTLFEQPEGIIRLSSACVDQINCSVTLVYMDRSAGEAYATAAMDDL